MKKLFLVILALMLVPAVAFAGAKKLPGGSIVEVLSLSADASAVALSTEFIGQYIYQIEIKTSADDAVVFTINSESGSTLFTKTTTAATSGEIGQPSGYYLITGPATYTLSGLGSGTAIITVSTP